MHIIIQLHWIVYKATTHNVSHLVKCFNESGAYKSLNIWPNQYTSVCNDLTVYWASEEKFDSQLAMQLQHQLCQSLSQFQACHLSAIFLLYDQSFSNSTVSVVDLECLQLCKTCATLLSYTSYIVYALNIVKLYVLLLDCSIRVFTIVNCFVRIASYFIGL